MRSRTLLANDGRCDTPFGLHALTAIEWPDDELRVYATLRGPLFAFSDDALLVYRQTVSADGELQIRRLHPMHPIDRTKLEPAAQEVSDALALLGRLHVGRNRRPGDRETATGSYPHGYPTAGHGRLRGHAPNQGRSRDAIDSDHSCHLLCAQR
jgi:hypothetical protein